MVRFSLAMDEMENRRRGREKESNNSSDDDDSNEESTALDGDSGVSKNHKPNF